jgi:glycosyltransferase involved in cell wall biosynthesis
LGIPDNQIVFLATGNFVPLKQFDKLIKTFKKLSYRSDLLLIIVGHGNKTNTDYLHSLIRKLVLKNKVILLYYLTGKSLRDLYWASDFYISAATEEGGPVSVMKAMACGLPIITTPVGVTSELMKKHDAGTFVPVKKYNEWVAILERMLDNGLPKPLDIQLARKTFHWENATRQFINIYNDLCKIYF